MTDEIIIPNALDRLSEREKTALRIWQSISKTQPQLSPDTQARLYSLFLQNITFDEIARLNKGIPIGQILECAYQGEWFLKRDEYIEGLLSNVKNMLQQSTIESVGFIIAQLAATHKKFGDSAKKYLQHGDESEFRSFGLENIKSYKVAIEALQKLTGQEGKTEVSHNVVVTNASSPANRAFTANEANSTIQAALLVKGKK